MTLDKLYDLFIDEKGKLSATIIYDRSDAWSVEDFERLAEKALNYSLVSYISNVLEDMLYG